MAMKTFRPVTKTLRYKTVLKPDQISTDTPFKPLLVAKKSSGGRNNRGIITVRHRGGGVKRFYRVVDFKRNKFDIPGVIETIERDPNRSCLIALVKYADGERRYILASSNLAVNQKVMSGEKSLVAEGNHLPLKNIPESTMVHNVEMRDGKGGQIVRSAGAFATIVAKENQMVQLKLPSGEIRNFREQCYATIGQVSNLDHMNEVLGSAGRKRHMGWRPTVRGMAMNPVDHPMGGGEGRSKSGGGRHHPVSPWGQKSKGLKTRKPKKASQKFIVRKRTQK